MVERASIHEDASLRERFAIKGRPPKTVIRIAAQEILSHCGKAPLRAGLWTPETWPGERPVATLMEIVRDRAGIEMEDVSRDSVDDLYRKTLY